MEKNKTRPLPDAFDGGIEDGLGFESHMTQSLPKSDLRNLPKLKSALWSSDLSKALRPTDLFESASMFDSYSK